MSHNPHADQLRFREWLVKQLSVARWSAPLSTPLPDLARELGVQEDVILEARALREEELRRRGKGGIAHGRRRYLGSDNAIVKVDTNAPIQKLWDDLRKTLGLETATLLRSLLHHFLLHPVRPKNLSKTWVYHGKIYRGPRTKTQLITRLTRGAQVAFDTHASEYDVPPTALARGLVIECLEGRTQKLKIVSFRELWGDPERYLHPEKFR